HTGRTGSHNPDSSAPVDDSGNTCSFACFYASGSYTAKRHYFWYQPNKNKANGKSRYFTEYCRNYCCYTGDVFLGNCCFWNRSGSVSGMGQIKSHPYKNRMAFSISNTFFLFQFAELATRNC